MTTNEITFTEGRIAGKLLRFALPVLGALFLQSLYGAVDLFVVGRFGTAADVSAVANGSMIMTMITFIITGLSVGTTIQMGQALGAKRKDKAGAIVGTSIIFFLIMTLFVTFIMIFAAAPFVKIMQTPKEALDKTISYVRICSAGTLFITTYNMLGGMFRGIGDSKTPLMTVLVACILNILGDLAFVGAFKMAASGAALATIISQGFSVFFCFLVIKKNGLPFPLTKKEIHWNSEIVKMVLRTGAPISLQDGLTTLSFLAIAAIINRLGIVFSAGVGVAERVCAFIMLVPSAFSQSLSAFVAQNIGAGKPGRARKAMLYAMLASIFCGLLLAYFAFVHGDLLSAIFTHDPKVIAASHDYLKAYAIDTLMVSFLFCFLGYFNGCGRTAFVMAQGLIGSFAGRIPLSYLFSLKENASLFRIGLAIPCSTIVQLTLCISYFALVTYMQKKASAIEKAKLS